MCYAQWKDTNKKNTKQTDSIYNAPWDDRSRHDMVFEERYGQKEKKQFKLMIPVSSIINFIKRMLK